MDAWTFWVVGVPEFEYLLVCKLIVIKMDKIMTLTHISFHLQKSLFTKILKTLGDETKTVSPYYLEFYKSQAATNIIQKVCAIESKTNRSFASL